MDLIESSTRYKGSACWSARQIIMCIVVVVVDDSWRLWQQATAKEGVVLCRIEMFKENSAFRSLQMLLLIDFRVLQDDLIL